MTKIPETQLAMAEELNQRLVDLYAESKSRGLSMPLYMALIGSHVAALAIHQEGPMDAAHAFCNAVITGTMAGLSEKVRPRGVFR